MENNSHPNIQIERINKTFKYDVAERKGLGHPDTLADSLAEELSRVYSLFTLSNFGVVLHHDFDKLGIVGGSSSVSFGKGIITRPIKVLLNGRASIRFGDKKIPLKELLIKTVLNFFYQKFPLLRKMDIKIIFNVSQKSSPGFINIGKQQSPRKFWFSPRGLEDLPETKLLRANDSVIACSYYPLTIADKCCLEVESFLNSKKYKRKYPWCGSDIKLQAVYINGKVELTMCVPQIAKYVSDINEYKENLETIKETVLNILFKKLDSVSDIKLFINMRDNFEYPELYLTAIGSSIESGDIGLVGRGNRVNGLITPGKPMSIEGVCGKNPVYHAGKVGNVLAKIIAEKVYEITQKYTEVFILTQTGQPLECPWKIIVKTNSDNSQDKRIKSIILEELTKIPEITKKIIKGRISLF